MIDQPAVTRVTFDEGEKFQVPHCSFLRPITVTTRYGGAAWRFASDEWRVRSEGHDNQPFGSVAKLGKRRVGEYAPAVPTHLSDRDRLFG